MDSLNYIYVKYDKAIHPEYVPESGYISLLDWKAWVRISSGPAVSVRDRERKIETDRQTDRDRERERPSDDGTGTWDSWMERVCSTATCREAFLTLPRQTAVMHFQFNKWNFIAAQLLFFFKVLHQPSLSYLLRYRHCQILRRVFLVNKLITFDLRPTFSLKRTSTAQHRYNLTPCGTIPS